MESHCAQPHAHNHAERHALAVVAAWCVYRDPWRELLRKCFCAHTLKLCVTKFFAQIIFIDFKARHARNFSAAILEVFVPERCDNFIDDSVLISIVTAIDTARLISQFPRLITRHTRRRSQTLSNQWTFSTRHLALYCALFCQLQCITIFTQRVIHDSILRYCFVPPVCVIASTSSVAFWQQIYN